MEQVVRMSKLKRHELLGITLKAAAKEVIGSCVSMGVTIEGKDPQEMQKEIAEGKYDQIFSENEK